MWHKIAAGHGNTEAIERLTALSRPSSKVLSTWRQEQDRITEAKLVCKRRQAKQRSDHTDSGAPRPSLEDGRQVLNNIRKNPIARQPADVQGPYTAWRLRPRRRRGGVRTRIHQRISVLIGATNCGSSWRWAWTWTQDVDRDPPQQPETSERAPAKGPTTFAGMDIQGAKLECINM
ncbi:hypothetical protein BU15DRAFT_61774 [Melanogaster broomeanus]|nr:hypothetical protein BU15DRAFT_61774 [Melanogaster broomeanus]